MQQLILATRIQDSISTISKRHIISLRKSSLILRISYHKLCRTNALLFKPFSRRFFPNKSYFNWYLIQLHTTPCLLLFLPLCNLNTIRASEGT